MFQFLHLTAWLLSASLLFGVQNLQEQAAKFRAHFAQESDPLRKARLMTHYGDLQFQDMQSALDDGNIAQAVVDLRNFRDQALSCSKSLDAKEADPEKHSGGFKQLQISVRESLRRLEDIIVRLNADDNKPFIEVRNDLEELDRHLVKELFPRQPAVDPKQSKPKS
ncbi:MAG: hypothetical protein ACRD5M_15660 [Candidatus Acidiferrales bacterium]